MENEALQNDLRGILSELEAKAPEIQRLKDEYAETIKMSKSTFSKLEVATEERMAALQREEEAQRERALTRRENDALKQQVRHRRRLLMHVLLFACRAFWFDCTLCCDYHC
jgi:hypothetical protein